jgi:anti-sigma factor RsiW
MNCAELEQLICDYVDGTLTADRKAEVERHLETCPPWRSWSGRRMLSRRRS